MVLLLEITVQEFNKVVIHLGKYQGKLTIFQTLSFDEKCLKKL